MRRLAVLLSPELSVAVSCNSRYDGVPWSGATNDPDDTPAHSWIGCTWQASTSGQWCSSNDHLSRLAGRFPSWASVACPENEILPPTVYVVPAAGVSMVAFGNSAPMRMV